MKVIDEILESYPAKVMKSRKTHMLVKGEGCESGCKQKIEANTRTMPGVMTNRGCAYAGCKGVVLGPLKDMIHIVHGPIGCSYYAWGTRRNKGRINNGEQNFLNYAFSTDMQDPDVVFGGEKKLTQAIKKLIEGNPNLSDLEGANFGEKLQNFYYALKHAEKIQIQRGLANNIDPEKEEAIQNEIKAGSTPNEKLVSKLTKEEKALVKKFNGTVFIEEMQERDNFGIRSYNPDNIVKLTEFSGYRKQETEFQNNLDETMEDLIKSMEKDKELKLKVLTVKSEIKDNNKTRFKRFTTQIQHADFGQTFKGKYSFIMDVPYPIEGKYIKFGGNDYVMVNQLFNKPIQKVNNQLVRLYTHYNTTSVSLKNSKFNGVYGLDNLEKEVIVTIKNIGPKIGVAIKTTPITDI
jgi:nitrogenase molybdenum-iron protein alpha/beta subunit